ncbi:MAG TPA: beta-ketoacyl-[acyl-carrier-protein] synthase family protein [Solirubrobacteraceae bacterium]|jgi:3-oxoacyl-[acyl-carrier-protein] synthase II|nr:beta-ketoacyl-[acyl-carrier-protein] synthase family protein [Solirubrobacteraceae bacterium]
MRRVVITGFGAITPLGLDAESTWESMKAGRSGIGPITTFDAGTYPVRIAGMVSGFDPDERLPDPGQARLLHRAPQFAVAAAVEALRRSGVEAGHYPAAEVGVAMGGSVARPELQEFSDIFYTRKESGGHRLHRASPAHTAYVSQNTASAVIAKLAGAGGAMIGISTACTASAHAVGEAYRLIQDGDAEMIIAGGHDSLTSWVDVLGFSLLGALTKDYNDDPTHASRPFDRDRSGFVLGEGAVVMVLEEYEAARRRGAPIEAEIVGYGSSLNAYRMTDPPPDGGGAVISMTAAMREADLGPADIDLVLAHGTGTPAGDMSETIAIKRAFGDESKRIVITSPKSMTGHTTCAAGALNLLAAVFAMRDGVVSPTINRDTPDPECDLDCAPLVAREMTVRAVMTNAFAFGGTNGALLVVPPEGRAA